MTSSQPEPRPRRILVAGGAGFIGSHLCERLIGEGHRVVALDNLHTGRIENLARLRGERRFEFVEHDVVQPIELAVDEIYNLACPASPVHYQRDPVRTTRTSVVGALNLLELARTQRARILQASTSEVYGDPAVHPQPEGYRGNVSTTGPRACYDEGKRCAETLFFDYQRQYGVSIKVARIFNTYGPRMQPDDGRVVSNFVRQALGGAPMTLYGDGRQTRSFCYVDDLVDGLVRLMGSREDFFGPVNLGNPFEVTMRELASLVRVLSGSTCAQVHEDLPLDDPRQRCPDIGLAQRELGWQPRTALPEGIARTIDDFRRRYGVERTRPSAADAVPSN